MEKKMNPSKMRMPNLHRLSMNIDCNVFWLFICICLLAGGWESSPVIAEDVATVEVAGTTIRKVLVKGNTTISDAVILSKVRSRPAAVIDKKLLSDDARLILALPEVFDVNWKIIKLDGGQVDVVFMVAESPRIKGVRIRGNKNVKAAKLMKELGFSQGDFRDIFLIKQGVEAISEVYHKKNYYFVNVELDSDLLNKEGEVLYTITEGPQVRVKKIKYEGNDSIPRRKLNGEVKSSSYFPIFSKGDVNDEQIESDVQSVAKYYHEEGFLDAQVFHEIEFYDNNTCAIIYFVIEEGPQYIVSEIQFEGNTTFTDDQLREQMSLVSGKILTNKRRKFARKSVMNAYGREGYIYADVREDIQYTDDEGKANVVYTILEDRQYYINRLIVTGNYQTRDKVVRRDFDRHGFMPGSIYNTEVMERATRRVKGSGLFESVTVNPIGQMDGQRDALVEVGETRTGLMMFGVGVDTNSGVIGQVSIEQRNFDIAKPPKSFGELLRGEAFVGGGQQMRLDFEPGTRVTRGRFKFHEPYLFDSMYYLDLNLFLFRRWRESYLERRTGGTITIGRRFDNDWSIEGAVRAELINVSNLDHVDHKITDVDDPNDFHIDREIVAPQDVQDVEGRNFLTSFKVGIGRNTTDRYLRPSEGYKINASWEQVGAFGGDFNYGAATASGTIYHTVYMDITERRTILAAQVRGSKIYGDAPVFERYYVGGIGSIRGFEYRGVSPRAGVRNDPIGSDYALLMGTELTHPLFEETLFGKVFCDGGLINEGPFRLVVGFGIELLIPQLFQQTPMHFDFGFPISSDPEDEEQLFSFNFGMNF